MPATRPNIEEITDWGTATNEEIAEGYRQMAADEDREAEALAWSEALIGDGFAEG